MARGPGSVYLTQVRHVVAKDADVFVPAPGEIEQERLPLGLGSPAHRLGHRMGRLQRRQDALQLG